MKLLIVPSSISRPACVGRLHQPRVAGCRAAAQEQSQLQRAVGIDRAGGLVYQREVEAAVVDTDLAGALDRAVDVVERVGRVAVAVNPAVGTIEQDGSAIVERGAGRQDQVRVDGGTWTSIVSNEMTPERSRNEPLATIVEVIAESLPEQVARKRRAFSISAIAKGARNVARTALRENKLRWPYGARKIISNSREFSR
jgi:hypothetical protein